MLLAMNKIRLFSFSIDRSIGTHAHAHAHADADDTNADDTNQSMLMRPIMLQFIQYMVTGLFFAKALGR